MDEFISTGNTSGYTILINKEYQRVYLHSDSMSYIDSGCCCFKQKITIFKKDVQQVTRIETRVGLLLSKGNQSVMIQCPNEEMANLFESFFSNLKQL